LVNDDAPAVTAAGGGGWRRRRLAKAGAALCRPNSPVSVPLQPQLLHLWRLLTIMLLALL